jgi:hypothetical protein
MLVFAISGAWQAFRLNDSKKDGSYRPPVAIATISQIHKAEHLKGPTALAFKVVQVLLALSFATTAVVGVTMALRIARPTTMVWLTLFLGALIPTVLAYFALH